MPSHAGGSDDDDPGHAQHEGGECEWKSVEDEVVGVHDNNM